MKTNAFVGNILGLQKDIAKIQKNGKIIKVVDLPAKQGVNVFLDDKISKEQAEDISRYIKVNYGVDAYFYRKDHAIKIFYVK